MMATTKKADSKIEAAQKYNGWPRSPEGLTWLPLSERWTAIISSDPVIKATRLCLRGTGKGTTAIHVVDADQSAKLLATFKKLVETETGDRRTWARAAVRRIETEAPKWNVGITGLRPDGWPLREKVATPVESKPVTKATATKTAMPRTKGGLRLTSAAKTPRVRKATPAEQKAVEAKLDQTDAQ